MPRPRKNFKIRPAKFLGLHRFKFQTTGTYTGHYKGPPISQRRLAYARNPHHVTPTIPFINTIIGSSLTKSQPMEKLSSKQAECVYLFSNVRTGQVIYSRTGHINPRSALSQLVFYGKKTVPEKYRKDDWRPYAVVQLRSKHEADHVYSTLRDLRLLRDYAWRKPGSPAPNRERRKKQLMDQKGSAVCDLSTAIAKAETQVVLGEMENLTKWKAVEYLALVARTGGLSILRKQISRAQRFLAGRKLSKKLRRTNRSMVVRRVRLWYMQQAMMQNAVSAVHKFRSTTLSAANRANTLGDKQSIQEKRSDRQSLREELKEGVETDSSLALAAAADPPPSRNRRNDVEITPAEAERMARYKQERAYVLHTLLPWVISRSTQTVPSKDPTQVLEPQESESVTTPSENATQLLPIWNMQVLETEQGRATEEADSDFLQQNYDRKYLTDPSVVKVFWNGIEDRKYTSGWAPTIEHRPMGPLMGIDQYFFRSPLFYLENVTQWEAFPFYLGDAENTGEIPLTQAERRVKGFEAEPEIDWKPSTKKEIKKHRKGKTGQARKEWRQRMGYDEDPTIVNLKIGKQSDTNPSETDIPLLPPSNAIDVEATKVRQHYEQFFADLVTRSRQPKTKIPYNRQQITPLDQPYEARN